MSSSSLPIPRQRAEAVDPAGSVLIDVLGDHLLVKLYGNIDRAVAANLDFSELSKVVIIEGAEGDPL